MRCAASLLIVAALAGSAAAQPTAFPFQAAPPPPKPDVVTLSFSPVHLTYPMAEITAEARLAPQIGVAVVLGAGRYGDWDRSPVDIMTYEVGGQLNYYIQHSFDGLHAGVEVLYVTFGNNDQNIQTGSSASVGPYVGYKAVASFGLTFIAQGGFGVSAYRAEDTDALGTNSRIFVLLNLNAGWTF